MEVDPWERLRIPYGTNCRLSCVRVRLFLSGTGPRIALDED